MRDTDREALRRVRSQAILVNCLRERLGGETKSALRSIRLDGMPRSGGTGGGLDARLIRQEEMARTLRREEALLRRREKAAREAMDGMKPELYAFCAMYYIGGMSVAEAAQALDRSERQCMRYKREAEEEKGEA